MPYATGCKDCGSDVDGTTRCSGCRASRNRQAREQRAERKRKHQCWACGEKCAKDESGRWLTSCEAHRGTAWRAA